MASPPEVVDIERREAFIELCPIHHRDEPGKRMVGVNQLSQFGPEKLALGLVTLTRRFPPGRKLYHFLR